MLVADASCLVFAYHEFGYAGLEALLEIGAPVTALLTHRDNPGEQVWWRSCAELAARHGIAVFYDEDFDAAWLERFRSWAPALIYSFTYRKLLRREILDCAALGAFNLHPSRLPAYRGRAPINWVLVNGEAETGVTLHHMVARADAGDIVGQRTVAIDDADTAVDLFHKLVPQAASLVRQYHPLIVAGNAPRIRQDLSAGSYFGRRTPADGLIDWRWPARRIFNLVRAVTHPYPGAFTTVAGRRLLIWHAALAQEAGIRGAPGAVLAHAPGGALEVAAGTGALTIMRAQWEGAEEAGAAATLEGCPVDGSFKLG